MMYAYEVRYRWGRTSRQCGYVEEALAVEDAVQMAAFLSMEDHKPPKEQVAEELRSKGVVAIPIEEYQSWEGWYVDRIEIMECSHAEGWHAEGAN